MSPVPVGKATFNAFKRIINVLLLWFDKFSSTKSYQLSQDELYGSFRRISVYVLREKLLPKDFPPGEYQAISWNIFLNLTNHIIPKKAFLIHSLAKLNCAYPKLLHRLMISKADETTLIVHQPCDVLGAKLRLICFHLSHRSEGLPKNSIYSFRQNPPFRLLALAGPLVYFHQRGFPKALLVDLEIHLLWLFHLLRLCSLVDLFGFLITCWSSANRYRAPERDVISDRWLLLCEWYLIFD